MPFLVDRTLRPWNHRTGHLAAWGAVASVLFASQALGVQWESQADRLQNISATLIDALPVPRPVQPGEFGLGLFTDVSFLPKVNTTVGSKTEKVPQAKFHLIPQLEAVGGYGASKSVGLGARAYGGFLPPMPKFLSGIEAKLTQFDFGAILDGSYLVSSRFLAFTQFGWHMASGKVKGRIASREGDGDTFNSSTRVFHLSLGMLHKDSRLYAAFLMGHKSTTSKLFIEEDDTELNLDDTLSDATVPLLSQSTLGWMSPFGVNVALSFLYVPNRLFMPRLSLGYVHTFAGGTKTTPAGDSAEGDAAAEATGGTGGGPGEAPSSGPGTPEPQAPGAAGSTVDPAGNPTIAPAVISPGAATPGKGKGKGAPRKQRRAPVAKPQPPSEPVTP